ncbi:MAG: hypothetical protein IAG13_24500 [Deltaproteobacteria bacterium]|nr:hypothetical protein [Nannocystaceae bacterium]
MIATARLYVWGVLVLAGACATPSESTCGAGTEADVCAASTGGSSSSGSTTFTSTAGSADDTTMSSTTVGSASGASSTGASATAASDDNAESGVDETQPGTTDATQGSDGTTGAPPCGNGMLDDGEACDGNDLAGSDCRSIGFAGGTLFCGADCNFDASACDAVETCGNGVVDEGEECDGPDLATASCEAVGGEFGGGELACNSNCSYDTSGCCVSFGGSCSTNECCALLFCGVITGLCI